MTKPTQESDQWQPCPPGALVRAVHRGRRRRRHEMLNRSLAAALLVLLTAWGGVFVASRNQSQREFDFGGIVCSRVRALMPEYMAGKLDAATSASIREHLAQCPHCGKLMEQMPAAVSAEMPMPVIGPHVPGEHHWPLASRREDYSTLAFAENHAGG